MLLIVLFVGALFLAYANGANDNFKGVATLYGSGTLSYWGSLSWATVTTFAGSVAAIFLARTLLERFTGSGLVPEALVADPTFLLAVAIGASATVMIATFTGFPISTTHAIVGALTGGGLAAAGNAVNFGFLGSVFFLPLLVSPLLAALLGGLFYFTFHHTRRWMNLSRTSCVCAVPEQIPALPNHHSYQTNENKRKIFTGDHHTCSEHYLGEVVPGVSLERSVNAMHLLSSGAVSFARGLNDTPKIAALLLVIPVFTIEWGMIVLAAGMAAGGLLHARKIAQTMSHRITYIRPGPGLTTNLATSFLVIIASNLGMPVSTTHVSVGALFGLGTINNDVRPKTYTSIISSWIVTLPMAGVIAALVVWGWNWIGIIS